jgi:tRNA A-37 threonylcarbamoyl transferase component Bud32
MSSIAAAVHNRRKRRKVQALPTRQDSILVHPAVIDALARVLPASSSIRLDVARRVLRSVLVNWCRNMGALVNRETVISSGKSGTVFQMLCRVAESDSSPKECVFVGKHIRGAPIEWIPAEDNVPSNPVRELFIQTTLAQLGIAVPALTYMQCTMTGFNDSLLIMERFPPGATLDKWLQGAKHRLAPPQYRAELHRVRELLLESILAMHTLNIVHGDLHPENIYVTDKGDVLLLDFGRSVVLPPRQFQKYGVMWDIMMLLDQWDADVYTSQAFFRSILDHAAVRDGVPRHTAAQQQQDLLAMLVLLRLHLVRRVRKLVELPPLATQVSEGERQNVRRFFRGVKKRLLYLNDTAQASIFQIRHGHTTLYAFSAM